MSKKFYVTTAIAYPNGKPHMGHALEIIQADAIARYHKLQGQEVFFQTGTDEHGVKNWETAKKLGVDVLDFLNGNVSVFKELYTLLGVEYDSFLRTSNQEIHYKGCQELWKKLVEADDIYKKKYSGLYCVGCESFKTEKELVEGKCTTHPNRDIQTIEEENYFFRLSKYKDQLIELIETDQYKVVPNTRKNEILAFLKDAKDISFSRPKASLPWGIPVPGDEDHVMYVWCDALSNYATGAGYGTDPGKFASTWPCDVHVIGKDILRFHAAYWPAMLLSAGVELPKQLFVHGFVLFEGLKMSKSTGVAIDPFDQLNKFGVNAFRFYLLGAMPIDSDGEYTEANVLTRTNNELVANLGNFCHRTLSFIQKFFGSSVTGTERDEVLEQSILELVEKVQKNYESFNFKEVVKGILEISGIGNKYLQDKAPWQMIKSDKEGGARVLGTCYNIARILSILIEPIMPDYSRRLRDQLNLGELRWSDIGFGIESAATKEAEIIVNKINPEDLDKRPLFPLNLKVGKILEVEKHPEADKLFVEKIDLGNETSQIVSGLAKYYSPEELVGKHVIVVTNLKKSRLRGVDSFGMLLAAGDEEVVKVLEAPHSPPGSIVVPEGYKPNMEMIKFDVFEGLTLTVKDKKVVFNDIFLKSEKEAVSVDVPDGFSVS